MNRIGNMLQGALCNAVLVIAACLLGWPIWAVALGFCLDLAITIVVVIGLRQEPGKGALREALEGVIVLIFGIFGLLYWAFTDKSANISSPAPMILALIGVPGVLMNLGVYIALVLKGLAVGLNMIARLLEIIAGETTGGLVPGGEFEEEEDGEEETREGDDKVVTRRR